MDQLPYDKQKGLEGWLTGLPSQAGAPPGCWGQREKGPGRLETGRSPCRRGWCVNSSRATLCTHTHTHTHTHTCAHTPGLSTALRVRANSFYT